MPNFQFTHLDYLTQQDPRLGETFKQLQDVINNISQQTASVPQGQQTPPAPPSSLAVVASGGIFDIAIQDNNPSVTGIAPDYFLEYSTTPGFQTPVQIHLGPARNHRVTLGNQTLYWRSYSQYGRASAASGKVYFGNAGAPTPVVGGGAIAGPTVQASAGSGTGPTSGYDGGNGYGVPSTRGGPR